MFVVPTALKALDSLSSIRVYIPKDLRPQENKLSVGKSIKEVIKRFPDGIPLLDPIDDMKIEDPDFKKLVRKLEMIEDKLATTSGFKAPDIQQRYDLYKKKRDLDAEIKATKKQMKISEDVILKQELKGMKRVLRR
jgi:ATP-dependent RNA helicase DOB1